jgi:hypothetical protein
MTTRCYLYLLSALTAMAGCFASPDFSKISCENGQPCAPGYQCNLNTKKCSKVVDALTSSDGGNSQFDISNEAGIRVDLATGIDTVGPDLIGVDLTLASPDSSIPDLMLSPEVQELDVASDLADTQADTPIEPDVRIIPDTSLDFPIQTSDTPPACSGACCKDTDCPGPCQSCSSSHTCVAVTGKDDPSGHCAGTCDSTGACKSKPGQACDTVASGCVSGSTCTDGYCCDRACNGTCEACNISGALGKCTALGAGASPRAGHGTCVATIAACAGSCDGTSGSCSYPISACGAASCTGTTYQPAGACRNGACNTPASQSCPANQTCSGNTCACVSPKLTCAGTCVDSQNDPKNCGACGHDCLGGDCVSGFCQPQVLVSNAGTSPRVIAIDSTNIFFKVSAPNSGGQSQDVYQTSKTTISTTGTKVVTGYSDRDFIGIIGNKLFSKSRGYIYFCDLGSCSETTAPGTGLLVDFKSPSPTYYVRAYDPSQYEWNWTWYDTSGVSIQTYTENNYLQRVYSSYLAFGNYVYWVGAISDSSGILTDVTVFSANTSNPVPARLSANLAPDSWSLLDANSLSLLLRGPSGLYRLSLPMGTPTAAPQFLSSFTSILNAGGVTEDTSGVYWFEDDGTLYSCSPSNCASTKKVRATGQAVDGGLYQDTTFLYWGTQIPSQIVRMVK